MYIFYQRKHRAGFKVFPEDETELAGHRFKVGDVVKIKSRDMEEYYSQAYMEYWKKDTWTKLKIGQILLDEAVTMEEELYLHKSSLNVIASRPNLGKTTLLLNIATNAIFQNKSVVIFSLEMSKDYIINRFNCLLSEQVYIDDTPAVTVEAIREKCIKLKKEQSLDLILIDYFQLITTEKHFKDKEQEISYISSKLKTLAQELDISIIVSTQLSKDLELREDKRPLLSDLKGTFIQDADVIMFLYRDDYYNKNTDNKGITEVIIVKNNYGNCGTIKLKEVQL